MRSNLTAAMICTCILVAGCQSTQQMAAKMSGWHSLFDGETLDGWRASENKDSFSVVDGTIVANGPRSHLFYIGPVENADFESFELKVDVKTTVGSNSGIYFHTAYQEEDWPAQGYEVQVNNTHTDVKKTGGLYAVKDSNHQSRAHDYQWFTEHIIVRGKHIIVKVNGKTTVDWTEPEGWEPPEDMPGRRLSHGTFALQGHDPDSIVAFRNIMVKPLP